MYRTDYCGLLTEEKVGCEVAVCGWVQTKRDMGGVIFVDLRDREGTVQTVFDAHNLSSEEFRLAENLRVQSVVSVSGRLRIRDEETYNPRLATGTIEIAAHNITLLSAADPLPFSLDNDSTVREDLRLKYRFLDLRRPHMLENLKLRHRITSIIRSYLDGEGFIDVETPILTKSTPEGARDYLVPSRVHPGTFYALPQSPQIFKQLLMVGGIDKYYQIARCFRDEDLRADRQPEFTQVDMEMSFVDQEDILTHLEKMFGYIFRQVKGRDIGYAFPRITWNEAMDVYGSDKPDLRFGLPIVELTAAAGKCSFSVFRKTADTGGVVRAINVKGAADMTRTEIEELTDRAVSYGAKGMAWIAVKSDGSLYSILTKYFEKAEMNEILRITDAKPGDFILFCADRLSVVRRVLGKLRLDLGDKLGLRTKNDFRFLFVTDFPQFEYSEDEGRYVATHHPFTMPYPEDVKYLLDAPEKVRAQAYDVVLNGIELGSGSIRIHDKAIQQTMFRALGFSDEEISAQFGFMVNAFRYGTPPHGGFAFGLDRLVMQLIGAESLREVIAFPKTKDASCIMTGAPDFVDKAQLEVLSLAQSAAQESESRRAARPKLDIENVANLARLSLNDEEKRTIGADMTAIIDFANQLSAIDTGNVKAEAYVATLKNVFREDVPKASFPRDSLLAAAPTKAEGCVTVPRVVEG